MGPEDVEVNLENEGSGWGEANDILTYVQSKVNFIASATCSPQCCTVACLSYILCSAKNKVVQRFNCLLKEADGSATGTF